jgi:hypothetical protein
MAGMKKCAHSACNCQVPAGQKFCSAACESARSVTELTCQCGHQGCQSEALKT